MICIHLNNLHYFKIINHKIIFIIVSQADAYMLNRLDYLNKNE